MPGEAQGLLEGGVRFEGGSGGGGAGCSSDGGGFVGYFLNSRILGMRCARALWAHLFCLHVGECAWQDHRLTWKNDRGQALDRRCVSVRVCVCAVCEWPERCGTQLGRNLPVFCSGMLATSRTQPTCLRMTTSAAGARLPICGVPSRAPVTAARRHTTLSRGRSWWQCLPVDETGRANKATAPYTFHFSIQSNVVCGPQGHKWFTVVPKHVGTGGNFGLTNLVIALHHMYTRTKFENKRKLIRQTDGGSDNVNRITHIFHWLLVWLGVFQEIEWFRFDAGHSHTEISDRLACSSLFYT